MMIKQILALTLASLPLSATAQGHNDFRNSITLPESNLGDFGIVTGHMFDQNSNYFGAQANAVLFESHNIQHKLGAEFLLYEKSVGNSFDLDIETTTVVANYTMEFNPHGASTFYIGAGVGFQYHNLDSDFDSLDSDTTGYAQLFAGTKFKISPRTSFTVGVRRMFLEEIDLFGVNNINPRHQWALEAGFSVRF